ncbi:YafY family transcriptional regulator [Glycomyces sp. L485]|nr:YafY family protein [Glycomyces sp. L485]MCH7229311.1 YafY family transcriptional regulator [Glycomyces sp. L485]
MLETSVRLLRLLAVMQSRRDWTGPDLAERLGVTTRTVRNDVDRLRTLGYRIRSTTGSAGGYRLEAGNTVPPLLLDEEESVAVAIGLVSASSGSIAGIEETALRALMKLEQTMPSRLRHRVDMLRAATVTASGTGPPVEPATLTTIADATRRREQLRFDYESRDGQESRRRAEPHRLVYTGLRWYLLAWDVDREDWRTFRADRIDPRTPNGPRFTPKNPPEDALTHVMTGIGSGAWKHQARIRFEVPATTVSERLPPGSGLLEPIEGGGCIWQTGSDSLIDLAAYMTRLDLPFKVESPPELRTCLENLAARFNAAADRDHSVNARLVRVRPGPSFRIYAMEYPK